MWYIWIIIVIILLIATHRYPSSFIFYFFLGSLPTFILSFIANNLILQTILFLCCTLFFSRLPIPCFLLAHYKIPLPILNTNSLINQVGQVIHTITASSFKSGLVELDGNVWPAVSNMPIKEGSRVQVTSIQGVRLFVIPIPNEPMKSIKKDDA